MTDLAMGLLGYPRTALDHYPTPAWVTEVLVPNLQKRGVSKIVEPACGDGAMASVLRQHFEVWADDTHHYGWDGQNGVRDFMIPGTSIERWVVTNPPYGDLAEEFIVQALAITRQHHGGVSMLLRNEYDSASSRRYLFKDHPAFSEKIILTKRPRWIPGSTGAPRHNYAWFIWDWRNTGNPEVSYG